MSKTYKILTRKIVLPEKTKVSSGQIKEIIEIRNKEGFKKNPVVTYSKNKYILHDGWEELLWAYHSNIHEIPSEILNIDEVNKKTTIKIRKLKNEKLNPITEAEYIHEVMEFKDYTQNELCKKINKTQGAISNKIRLLKLPEEIIENVENRKINERQARSLLKYDNKNAMIEALNSIMSEKMNVAKTEEFIQNELNIPIENKSENIKKRKELDLDGKIVINTIKNSLKEVKGTIDKYGYSKKIEVDEVFASDEDEFDYTVVIKIREKD